MATPSPPAVDRAVDASGASEETALLAALEQPIEKVNVSLLYRVGLLFVAFAMVLLPLLYLALIAGLGWLVYLHAVHNVGILSAGGGGRAMLLKLVIYVGPIIAGGAAILFMFKPILARPAKGPESYKVDATGQPFLFRFVEHLTRLVGAPMPKEIHLDCEVNASAGFRRGMLSFFGSDLVLTIGLPLVSGLNVRQLTGILAHEFGHFAQGGAMRLTYVIRSINGWFARVVYERDQWDEYLERTARESEHWAASLIVALTRGTVWFSRRVLWVLMHVGHGISCFMLRQMEYDADRYEARVSGSDTFGSSARRLAELSLGSQVAFNQLREAWNERRLGDDLPALIAYQTSQMATETRNMLHKSVMEEETGWFATHPSDRDRIRRAQAEAAPGIFRFDQPASLLFRGYDALARRVTIYQYRSVFGLEITPAQLVSTAQLAADEAALNASHEALGEIFGEGLLPLRPVPIVADATQPPAEPAAELAKLRAVRQEMAAAVPAASQATKDLNETYDQLFGADRAGALLAAGYTLSAGSFPIPTPDLAGVESARDRAFARYERSTSLVDRQLELAGRRLGSGLRFLHAPLMSARIESSQEWQNELSTLLPALERLSTTADDVLAMQRNLTELSALFHGLESNEGDENTISRILSVNQATHQQLQSTVSRLAGTAYPFSHASGEADLAQVVLDELPDADDVGATAGATEHVCDTLSNLYYRVLGRLCLMTLEVEKAAGLAKEKDAEGKPTPAE